MSHNSTSPSITWSQKQESQAWHIKANSSKPVYPYLIQFKFAEKILPYRLIPLQADLSAESPGIVAERGKEKTSQFPFSSKTHSAAVLYCLILSKQKIKLHDIDSLVASLETIEAKDPAKAAEQIISRLRKNKRLEEKEYIISAIFVRYRPG